MAAVRDKRRPMSEINVVPYIDVMLVLLVIFMVTAPLLYQGVDIDLPQTDAAPVDNRDVEPLIVEVDRDGKYYASIGDPPEEPLEIKELVLRVAAVLKHKPGTPVLVRGDKNVPYGKVVTAMAYLQQAGVPKVGLMTQPAEP